MRRGARSAAGTALAPEFGADSPGAPVGRYRDPFVMAALSGEPHRPSKPNWWPPPWRAKTYASRVTTVCMDETWEQLFGRVFTRKFANSDMAVQQETLQKRAAAVRPILVELAEAGEPGDEAQATQQRDTLTYGELAKRVGSDATYIPKVLGAIDLVGAELGDPPLSPLVESSRTVGPGRGYFNWEFHGEDRIPNPGERNSLTSDMEEAWRRHLRTAYKHEGWYRQE